MEKVDGVGEHGGGHVVEQRRGSLGGAGGEVPDDAGGAGAVVPPGVGQCTGKEGEGSVFTPAVHAHLRQPPQRRRVQQLAQKRRGRGVIERQQSFHGNPPGEWNAWMIHDYTRKSAAPYGPARRFWRVFSNFTPRGPSRRPPARSPPGSHPPDPGRRRCSSQSGSFSHRKRWYWRRRLRPKRWSAGLR